MKDIKSYLSFKIGSEYYAANVDYVQNIIEYCKITKVPEMPKYMLGIINLRGQVLPVIDSRIKFGVENIDITTNTCILVMEVVIENEDAFIGVLVDEVAEVFEIEDSLIKETPGIGTTIRNDLITGVYHDDKKFILILDINRVLANSEILKIQEMEKENS